MLNQMFNFSAFRLLRTLSLLVLVWGFTVCGAPAQTGPKVPSSSGPKNILVLHAFESNMPTNLKTAQGLMASLNSGGLEINNQFFESLDLARHPGREHRKLLAELMRVRYGQLKIDMIVTLYTEALHFVLNEGRTVFRDVPILALYVAPDMKLPESKRLIILQSTTLDMIGTLEGALKLFPKAKRVYVVNGAYPGDKKYETQARGDFKKWEGRLDFRYLSGMPLENILSEVSDAPSGTIVLYISFRSDIKGKMYVPRDVAQQLCRISKAPVFGLYDNLLGYGIVGGTLVNFEHVGKKAGELVMKILKSERGSEPTPSVLDVPSVRMFDWHELRRWNLNADELPTGSIVINREFTFWDFRYYIILCLALVLAEAALILVLITQRRRMRKAEEKYRNIFQGALEGVFETSPQGQLLTANPALASMLGHDSPADAIASIRDTAHQVWANPNERAECVRLLEKEDVVRGFECQFLRRDGTKFWVSLNTRRETGPGGQTLFYSGFVEDISERKQAERALEEQLKFETLLADLSARFINLPADLLDAEIEDVQRRICEWLGLDLSALWQLSADHSGPVLLTHLYAPKDLPPVPKNMDAKETFPWGLEKALKHENTILSRVTDAPAAAARDLEVWRHYGIKSVLTLPLSAGRGPTLGALSFSAIRDERDWPTELVNRLQLVAEIFANALARRRAEEAIKKSEAKYRRLHESMMDGFVLVRMDGMIREYNESYRQMTGYAPEELSKLTYRDLTPEKWHDFEQKIIDEQVLMQGYSEVYEKEYRKKDGTIFPVELRTFLVKEETGSNSGMWAIVRDITERRQAEQEIALQRNELAHVTRVSTMGQLASSLAHELSQPLGAILRNAEAAELFLQDPSPDLDEVRAILADIRKDDQRAGEVVDRTRGLLKRRELERRRLSMDLLLAEIVSLVQPDAGMRGVRLTLETDPTLPSVHGDRVQLQQVLLYLLLNAVAGVNENPLARRLVSVRALPVDAAVEFAGSDTGPGIPADNLSRVFEPFFSSKPDGLGMGLAISRSIVEAYGGRLWAENNPDGGATFHFTVPVSGEGQG